MRPLTDKERFVPTQPVPELQERLRAQRRWARPPYTPNHVPKGGRILYALLGLTWATWAMIGLLSGHMFLLVSKRGPIHFSGVPAVLFSLAVMASAATFAVAIVDHYDKRDNEEAYGRMRRRLWWAAAGLLCMAAVVGLAERIDLLPYTSSTLGLLSTQGLQNLLASSWLSDLLTPHRASIEKWSIILLLWCFAGTFVLQKLGLMRSHDSTPRPGLAVFVILFLVGPAVTAFTLSLVATLASGSFPSHQPLSDESLRAQLAWIHSMLLTAVSLLAVMGLAVVVGFLRILGVLPEPTHRAEASADESSE